MADSNADALRAMTQVTAALIELAARLSQALIEMRVQRLRAAAIAGEHAARVERARLGTHHAADVALWRRTTSPVWWQTATPDQIARAWQAVNTWHHVDDEAAGVRQAMAQRLRDLHVQPSRQTAADPDNARWLHTELARAQAEGQQPASQHSSFDTDQADLADEIWWDSDELPPPPANRSATGQQQRAQDSGWQPSSRSQPSGVTEPSQLNARNRPQWSQAAPTAATANIHERTSSDSAGHATIIEAEVLATRQTHHPDQPSPRQVPHTNSRPHDATTSSTSPANPPSAATSTQTADGTTTIAAAGRASPAPSNAPASAKQHRQPPGELDLNRMESVLRNAWPEANADRAVADAAWPMLAQTMHQLEHSGANVHLLLEKVLPMDTTQAKLPAVLTAWGLRNAAAGPSQLRKAQRQRASHQQRIQRHHEDLASRGMEPTRQPSMGTAQAGDDSSATLLRTAFPATTKQAINRPSSNNHAKPSLRKIERARNRHRGPATQERGRPAWER